MFAVRKEHFIGEAQGPVFQVLILLVKAVYQGASPGFDTLGKSAKTALFRACAHSNIL